MPLLIISPIAWIDRSRSPPILGAFPRPTFKAPSRLIESRIRLDADRLSHVGALSVSSVLELPLCCGTADRFPNIAKPPGLVDDQASPQLLACRAPH
jgi:hypothetical protein